MYTRRYWLARAAAILEVVMIFGAWASAQFPYLLVSDITGKRRGFSHGES